MRSRNKLTVPVLILLGVIIILIILGLTELVFSGFQDRQAIKKGLRKIDGIEVLGISGDFKDGITAELRVGGKGSINLWGLTEDSFSRIENLWVLEMNAIKPIIVSCNESNKTRAFAEGIDIGKESNNVYTIHINSIEQINTRFNELYKSLEKLPNCPQSLTFKNNGFVNYICRINADLTINGSVLDTITKCENN